MIYTGQAIEELTGFKQPSAQRRCLAAMGIKPCVRADGSLSVTEAAVTQAMLASKAKAKEPNFGAIKP